MPALPACYSHYSRVELFRSSLNFREGRQAGMPALPLLAEWLAVGIKFDYFTKAEFAHAGLNLPQVSNYYPDYFPGPNEFLSGCIQLVLCQHPHVASVSRPVICRKAEIDHSDGGVFQRGQSLKAARQTHGHIAHHAGVFLAGHRAFACQSSNLLRDFDHRLLGFVGLHRRDHQERSLSASAIEHALRSITPMLIESEISI